MNFYTFFKTESKRLYKHVCSQVSSDYLSSHGLNNLSCYRNMMLRISFGISSLNVSHFQCACYRVIPLDLPKNFYSDLWNYLFSPICSFYVTDKSTLSHYKECLVSELVLLSGGK